MKENKSPTIKLKKEQLENLEIPTDLALLYLRCAKIFYYYINNKTKQKLSYNEKVFMTQLRINDAKDLEEKLNYTTG